MTLRVHRAGILSTLQDRGRYGYQRYGMPVGGVMDEHSHRLANLLVRNAEDDATLELTLAGPRLEFTEGCSDRDLRRGFCADHRRAGSAGIATRAGARRQRARSGGVPPRLSSLSRGRRWIRRAGGDGQQEHLSSGWHRRLQGPCSAAWRRAAGAARACRSVSGVASRAPDRLKHSHVPNGPCMPTPHYWRTIITAFASSRAATSRCSRSRAARNS